MFQMLAEKGYVGRDEYKRHVGKVYTDLMLHPLHLYLHVHPSSKNAGD